MQGDFLAQVFGDALEYTRFSDNADVWHLEQHRAIGEQTPDAVLGRFTPADPAAPPLAVIELKGPGVHLDRDRSQGRTAVDQCWDYLNNTPPTCRWGIVSNIISFRLYERDSTKRAYEHFTLQGLRDRDEFRRFYALFRRRGLIEGWGKEPPTAIRLLQETNQRQRQVSDELYESYSKHRFDLIGYLRGEKGHPVETAIEMAQRLFDRVIFIAFCEDRQLLPADTIRHARQVTGFAAVTNPRWQSFKNLFRFIHVGNDGYGIPKYNGGLFAQHEVDRLELPDEPWTTFFQTIGGYDFRDEVNLDVLGHLFERSVTELEKLKQTGLFASDTARRDHYASMPQSVKRKQLGIYYTPPELTGRIVQYTVEELIVERFAALGGEFGGKLEEGRHGMLPEAADFWRGALAILQNLKIVDPACGSGAFLFQAYNVLEQRYNEVIGHLDRTGAEDGNELAAKVPHWILSGNLYGVDLSPEAVEITQLALWIRSATEGQTLATLSRNIVHGNSLVHDPEMHAAGFDWRQRFSEVFDREQAGFDCVIGNPPWERIKLQEREFFSLPAPEIATATNAAKRRQLVAKLESDDPALYERYQAAQSSADALLTYCRKSDQYPLTGRGDINLYAVFAELAYKIVAPSGRVGLLTPSGIAAQATTKEFFAAIAESNRLIRLYEFDNRRGKFFPDVHRDTQFVILNFLGAALSARKPDFIFGALDVEELEDRNRHIAMTGDDIRLLNPNTHTCPIFRTQRDAEITKAIYRRVPVLIDNNRTGPTGNPWGIRFKTIFHQTNDAELFREAESLKADKCKLKGNLWVQGKQIYLPLYEAKMIEAYDHRYGTVYIQAHNWVNQGQTIETSEVQHANPEFLVLPRYWAEIAEVRNGAPARPAYLAFRDITNPTNARTMISAFVPRDAGFINTLPMILIPEEIGVLRQTCLQANFGAYVFDYVARNKVHGRHMNFFALEQLPTFSPDHYTKRCPWDRKTTLEQWISERVLKLTCTAEDMLPLAEACQFTGGSFQSEYDGRLNRWDEAERATLLAELDAAFFHLYGLNRADAEYILSTFTAIHDRRTPLPGHRSIAEHVLDVYDELGGTER